MAVWLGAALIAISLAVIGIRAAVTLVIAFAQQSRGGSMWHGSNEQYLVSFGWRRGW
jgi:hypothetical protein